MSFGYRRGTGTVNVAVGGTALTGTGTAFATEAMAGGTFETLGLAVRIEAITSDTEITLSLPWPGAAITAGSAFNFGQLPGSAVLSLQVSEELRQLIAREQLKSDLTFVDAVPLNSVGDVGDAVILRSNADVYEKTASGWVQRLTGFIASPQVSNLVVLTQAEFDALAVKDTSTLYHIRRA